MQEGLSLGMVACNFRSMASTFSKKSKEWLCSFNTCAFRSEVLNIPVANTGF